MLLCPHHTKLILNDYTRAVILTCDFDCDNQNQTENFFKNIDESIHAAHSINYVDEDDDSVKEVYRVTLAGRTTFLRQFIWITDPVLARRARLANQHLIHVYQAITLRVHPSADLDFYEDAGVARIYTPDLHTCKADASLSRFTSNVENIITERVAKYTEFGGENNVWSNVFVNEDR